MKDLDIDSLLSVPSVSSFDVSKSGKLVFCSNKSKQWQLYAVDQGDRPQQLTFNEESKIRARFLPDGKRVLFASDRQGDEKFNLYSYNIDTSGVRNLTPGTDFAIFPNATFSDDGKKIAYVSNESGEFATYLLDGGSLGSKRVSNHEYSDGYAVISPDGSQIAISSAISGQDSGIFLASTDNLGKEPLRLLENGVQIDADQQVWSPDGKKLAFVSSSKGWYDIGIWDIEKDSIYWITKSDHEYYEPAFSNDGRKLAYLANVGGDIKLVVHDLESNEGANIEFRHGLVSSPKFSSDDRLIYFLFSGPRNPTDVWQYRFKDEKFVQLTNSLPGDIDVSNFVDGEQIAYPCKKDGTRVPALLFMPNRSQERNAQKKLRGKGTRENLPLVIEIHGGPTAQSLNEWNPLIQALVSRGMVVLSPNYRGSTGYGRKFREANRFVMGDLDLDDCVSGRDFLLERRVIDPKRVAVTGASFGGYLTMCSLTKYPDRWTCGAALVPFLNWFTEIQNEREDLRYWDAQNMGDPQKDKERLREASPIFFIDRIKSPVLLVAGANDPRCPLEESMQAKEGLERLGKQAELVAYMDEGHGFRKMENKVDAYKKTIAFLEKHLCEKGGS